MATRKTRPTSPGRRFGTYQLREELSATEPEKGLTEGKTRGWKKAIVELAPGEQIELFEGSTSD